VSWWNLEVSKSLSACLERFVCHFSQYGFNWISSIIFLGTLTIVIPQLPCIFRMANAVSSTVELLYSVTSDSVNSFNFVMWAFANKCFPIELVPCSDGWRRTWWHTIHMMPGLPVSSIPHCKQNRHDGACLEFFHAIGRFQPTFIEAHQPSKMICNVRSLKSRIKTRSLLEEIITSSNDVFKDCVSDMVIEFGKLGMSTRETAENNDTLTQNAGSYILTLLLIVLATGLDRHFRSGYRSEPNRSQIGGPGGQYTRTVNSGTVPSTSPYLFELGGYPAGCTVGPSVKSYNMRAFAIRL